MRFHFYLEQAPFTCPAFYAALPFVAGVLHARVSGEEIWTDTAPAIDVIQENASVFTQPGEVVLGPVNSTRAKTAGMMGIYYGEGRGLDACNIFARVEDECMNTLRALGERVWRQGGISLSFEKDANED